MKHRVRNTIRIPVCNFVLVLILTSGSQSLGTESLQQSIDYLLNYVATSDATFIRNGESHTAAEAAVHIKAKYQHFKNEIQTSEDFIRLCAAKSLLTEQPYLVRTADGKQMRLDAWLTEALKKHRGE